MKHFEKRETFRHKEDAKHLADVLRSRGQKARVVGHREHWTVYEGLLRARIKGHNEEKREKRHSR